MSESSKNAIHADSKGAALQGVFTPARESLSARRIQAALSGCSLSLANSTLKPVCDRKHAFYRNKDDSQAR
jgi:hypothetical protein